MLSERVRNVIANVFNRPVDDLPPELTPKTVAGWNSFQHIRIIIALENEFGIEIDPDAVPTLVTDAGMVDYLGARLGVPAGAGQVT